MRSLGPNKRGIVKTLSTYHRNEASYQTAEDAELQVASSEIWGRAPKNGLGPTVQAYRDGAIKQKRRLEFTTEVKAGSESPFEAWWYLEITPGVEKRERDGEVFACIAVDVIRNLQV